MRTDMQLCADKYATVRGYVRNCTRKIGVLSSQLYASVHGFGVKGV